MDNSNVKNSSVSIKNKKRSLARYDYHDIIGLVYTVLLVVGLGLGMAATSVWQYYSSAVGDKANFIGLLKYLTEVKQFHFNGAYNFAVLLLWCAVGFILAKAFLKFAKTFQKTTYSPKEFSKLTRIFALCFGVSALSFAIYAALTKNWILLVPAIGGALVLIALFLLWGHFISQNPKSKAFSILMAVFYAIFNLPSFICFLICAFAVKKSSSKEETSTCWVYPVLLSTIPAVAVVAFIFLKLPELVYANTIVLFMWIAAVALAITLLVLPSFFYCYYYFKMYLPAADASYYNVASTSVLGEKEDDIYDDAESMEKAKAKKSKSLLTFSLIGFIPAILTFISMIPSLIKVACTAFVVLVRGAYGVYVMVYDVIGWVAAKIYGDAAGVAVRAKPLPEMFISEKLRYDAIDWIPGFDGIREKIFDGMAINGSIDWIPSAILAAFLLFSIFGLLFVFITRSKVELYRHEFGKIEGTAKKAKLINTVGLLLGIFNALVLIVMTYISFVDLVKILNTLSL